MNVTKRMSTILKEYLPNRYSFRLRYLKSGIVDDELRKLKQIAQIVGGPGHYAIDVGANWGIYSEALSQKFQGVYCIEPNKSCAAYLRSIVNNKCVVIEAAASNFEGIRNLRIPVESNRAVTTRGTISEDNEFADIENVSLSLESVSCIKLDNKILNLLPAESSISLLKLDVEGHELEALQGSVEMLNRFKPVLYIEVEQRHGTRTSELRKLLKQVGYSSYVFREYKQSQSQIDLMSSAVNMVFLDINEERRGRIAKLRDLLTPIDYA